MATEDAPARPATALCRDCRASQHRWATPVVTIVTANLRSGPRRVGIRRTVCACPDCGLLCGAVQVTIDPAPEAMVDGTIDTGFIPVVPPKRVPGANGAPPSSPITDDERPTSELLGRVLDGLKRF